MTARDPDVRRTLARLRLVRMAMRRNGALALQGRNVDLRKTDLHARWSQYGWQPRSQ